ncbi:hypothetical protein EFK50_01420 [Nocardioides marmoriginsengisoli]|uniref:Uncharacterized protein n=1 Tax=Nocardioides marmoriginsengisoli TaxID=661483 RepID=A0A3N0CRV1_9ACTN|nr:hypothetical protein [Nocardioides marmoriginsengisoli]RNL65736.1 hypothetical protein EFK50_01420 [Nocardioides marmoriginsengisoli]
MTGAIALLVVTLAMTLLTGPAQAARRDPDGRYKGSLSYPLAVDSGPVTFRIARDGKRLTKWRATFTAVCNYDPYVALTTVTLPTTKIRRDGTFRGVVRTTHNGKVLKLTVTGQLRGKRVTKGRINYDIGSCSRKANWTARRVGA